MTERWEQRRSSLNHDWFKRYLYASARWINVMEGRVEPAPAQEPFLSGRVTEWEAHRAELDWLLEHFCDEMSPRVLFDHPPLDRCPAETRAWLSLVIDGLWRVREGVPARLAALKRAIQDADGSYNALIWTARSANSNESDAAAIRLALVDFHRACSRVFTALQQFPRAIKVT